MILIILFVLLVMVVALAVKLFDNIIENIGTTSSLKKEIKEQSFEIERLKEQIIRLKRNYNDDVEV